MKVIKSFFLVVVSLLGELWTGYFNRSSEFYDKHTATKTKTGYVFFVTLATLVTISAAAWLCLRIY
ncbi:hypothetical protein Back11_19240 [Paenibacillus baekrokdamisoli]|uniref:Uncharacterized protein n=1 Tax=Paenibacillus baekrokdamisoli TaxID=1712516 RepID=A0A3G9JCA0_9BACL|nr:hypothetical protein [Paenibacillus baekrokdamisoli]MBB3072524.1 multisubunit Na+/H+ antiporter MnhG subunit [Paenibacillus baekrokdamisoli]BBH20579.1 hypothetical protein Back11_19240 [Paenibacillus baekrokdamisoli]